MKFSRVALLGCALFAHRAYGEDTRPDDVLTSALIEASTASGVIKIQATSNPADGWDSEIFSSEGKQELPAIYNENHPTACSLDALQAMTISEQQKTIGFVLLAKRGNCTYAQKALNAAQYGAKALIVMNTPDAVYASMVNSTNKYATNLAFDCSRGSAMLQGSPSVPVNAPACSANPSCESKICIPTANTTVDNQFQVCCMWDMKMSINSGNSGIPVLFISVGEGDALLQAKPTGVALSLLDTGAKLDPASFILWALAVFSVVMGSYFASAQERYRMKKKLRRRRQGNENALIETTTDEPPRKDDETEHMNIGFKHVIGFIVIASGFLIVLFYLNVYIVVSVFYMIGAAAAVSIMVTYPITEFLMRKVKTVWQVPKLGALTPQDVVALLLGIGLAVWWFVERKSSYAWVLQDIFGVSLSIMFLSTLRTPNLKIATVLFVLAFIYDVFFVFISPYIFKDSVMVQVATGGSQNDDSIPEGYCLRYPHVSECAPKESLPMVLRFPKLLGSQTGGYSLLGLGDIVIPGLLLAFCARYDYALLRDIRKGYLMLTVVGYAIALLMANIGVVLMQHGQPALMYIVPLTLIPLTIMAACKKELGNMWNTPKEFGSTSSATPSGAAPVVNQV